MKQKRQKEIRDAAVFLGWVLHALSPHVQSKPKNKLRSLWRRFARSILFTRGKNHEQEKRRHMDRYGPRWLRNRWVFRGRSRL